MEDALVLARTSASVVLIHRRDTFRASKVLQQAVLALGLPGDGTAHVGLTAATGERWQAHDVTSWAVCDRPGRDAVP